MDVCVKCGSEDVIEKTGKIAIDGGLDYNRFICRTCKWDSGKITSVGVITKDYGFNKDGKLEKPKEGIL